MDQITNPTPKTPPTTPPPPVGGGSGRGIIARGDPFTGKMAKEKINEGASLVAGVDRLHYEWAFIYPADMQGNLGVSGGRK